MTAITTKSGQKRLDICVLHTPKWAKTRENPERNACNHPRNAVSADNKVVALEITGEIRQPHPNAKLLGKYQFDIPAYRGLEPNLGLVYNSSNKGLGSAETWTGVGWQLTGLSSIERVTIGGGTPTFEDTRDFYRLDGMDLMACDDTQATNPWGLS